MRKNPLFFFISNKIGRTSYESSLLQFVNIMWVLRKIVSEKKNCSLRNNEEIKRWKLIKKLEFFLSSISNKQNKLNNFKLIKNQNSQRTPKQEKVDNRGGQQQLTINQTHTKTHEWANRGNKTILQFLSYFHSFSFSFPLFFFIHLYIFLFSFVLFFLHLLHISTCPLNSLLYLY